MKELFFKFFLILFPNQVMKLMQPETNLKLMYKKHFLLPAS